MSGGALTDYQHDLYRMCEWGDNLEKVNPVLAWTLHELCNVLVKYDRFLSGDTDEDIAIQRWRKFTGDFIGMLDDF